MTKYNIGDTAEVLFINKNSGEVEAKSNMTFSIPNIQSGNNKRLPRSYAIKDVPGNQEFYEVLQGMNEKVIYLDNDPIKGTFKVSLEPGEAVITEVLS